jgi:hypothetical protein
MTDLGICHNATFADSRISPVLAGRLGLKWVRTIVYDPINTDHPDRKESFDRVIASARELKDLAGVDTLVVFNSESFGGADDDIDQMTTRLEAFLNLADGAVAAIEPGNELDHQAVFHLSDQRIIDIGRAAAEVCHRHNVKCLSPSLLTGPEEGHFETIAKGLAGHVDAMAVHPYYCSVGGKPFEGFVFDTVEHKAEVCDNLARQAEGVGLSTWFTELGCPSSSRWYSEGERALIRNRLGFVPEIGPADQAAFTAAVRSFQHDAIEVIMQFALFDTVVPQDELNVGKDWGLLGLGNVAKASFAEFGVEFA